MPEGEGVIDGVPEFEAVPEEVVEAVLVGVNVEVGVTVEVFELDGDEPDDDDGVGDGVGEGEGITTPITKMGEAYMVPAFVTGFHALVVNDPAATPVHTLAKDRIP